MAVKGCLPDERLIAQRDAERNEAYVEKFAGVKDVSKARSETATVNFAKVRAERAERGESPRSSSLAGKIIKVLNKNHGARPGSKRCTGLELILEAKTTDAVLPQLVAAGCNGSFIKFAVEQGFIELI
jgi:hypothetical protein